MARQGERDNRDFFQDSLFVIWSWWSRGDERPSDEKPGARTAGNPCGATYQRKQKIGAVDLHCEKRRGRSEQSVRERTAAPPPAQTTDQTPRYRSGELSNLPASCRCAMDSSSCQARQPGTDLPLKPSRCFRGRCRSRSASCRRGVNSRHCRVRPWRHRGIHQRTLPWRGRR